MSTFDIKKVRGDFPILGQEVHGKPLVYLDSAATSQKPTRVLDAITHYYCRDNANVHRGVHALSERATNAYEGARSRTQKFINAKESSEIVFVRGTTEGINLVAQSFLRPQIQVGDEIVVTVMEHHSNIVPWQLLCDQTGASLKVVPINESGELVFESYLSLLTEKTRMVAVGHVSNALGTVNPIKEIVSAAHRKNIPVLVDGAQAVQHMEVDVQALDCDFYTFSGHKMYGPTGIGVLYGKANHFKVMEPYQGGGEMIRSVTFTGTEYNVPPHKFEAGTPNIAGAVGLHAAMDYLSELGLANIHAYEHSVLEYGTQLLQSVGGVKLIGTASDKSSVLSFILDGVHPHDVGTILDQQGVAVRTGHHCAQPVMDFYKLPATTRASLGVFNTKQDMDALAEGLKAVKGVFGV